MTWPIYKIFFHAKTTENKAAVVNKYAREHLDMTADVDINDDKQRRSEYKKSSWKKYCKSPDQEEDVRQLVEDCMCHQCNKYCLRLAKINMNGPRTCRVYFGTETKYKKQDTQVFHVQKGPKYSLIRKASCISE